MVGVRQMEYGRMPIAIRPYGSWCTTVSQLVYGRHPSPLPPLSATSTMGQMVKKNGLQGERYL